jgi:hypothetical protein
MEKVRIFESPYVGVRYAAGRPLTVQEFNALSKEEQDELRAKVRG